MGNESLGPMPTDLSRCPGIIGKDKGDAGCRTQQLLTPPPYTQYSYTVKYTDSCTGVGRTSPRTHRALGTAANQPYFPTVVTNKHPPGTASSASWAQTSLSS